MSRVRRDLRAAEQQIADMRRLVEQIDGRLTLLSLTRDAAAAPTTPPAPSAVAHESGKVQQGASKGGKSAAKVARPVLPVVRLANRVPAQVADENGDAVDAGAVDDGSPPIMIRIGPGGAPDERLSVDRKVLNAPDPGLGKKDAKSRDEAAPDRQKDDQ